MDKTMYMHSAYFKQFMLKLIVKVICKFSAKTDTFCQVLHLNTPMKMYFQFGENKPFCRKFRICKREWEEFVYIFSCINEVCCMCTFCINKYSAFELRNLGAAEN